MNKSKKGLPIKARRKAAIVQLEHELTKGNKPTKKSAADAQKAGLKKFDGKYREPLSNYDSNKKRQQIRILKERVA